MNKEGFVGGGRLSSKQSRNRTSGITSKIGCVSWVAEPRNRKHPSEIHVRCTSPAVRNLATGLELTYVACQIYSRTCP
jgi:hypothetical protein